MLELGNKIMELNKLVISKQDTRLVEYDIYRILLKLFSKSLTNIDLLIEEILSLLREFDDLQPTTIKIVFKLLSEVMVILNTTILADRFRQLLDDMQDSVSKFEYAKLSSKRVAEMISKLESKLQSIQDENEKRELERVVQDLRDELVRNILYE